MSSKPARYPLVNDDETDFIDAVTNSDVDKARTLLDNGASPDIYYSDGGEIVPIHIAVANRDLAMAKLLVERGSGFHNDDFEHHECHFAATRGDTAMLSFLMEKREERGLRLELGLPEEETPLHSAARSGSLDCAQLLVRHGANIHARHHWKWTPLFSAACNPAAVSVLEFLADSGVDVNAADSSGSLPIWHAAFNNNFDGVRALVSRSSCLDNRNNDGETVIHAAAYGGSLAMLKFLVSAGADITATSGSNSTALHRVAEVGNTEAVRWLLDAHAPHFGVNDTTSYGWTPLLFAACENRTSTARLLLERGADVGVSPRLGCSPLHLAAGHCSGLNPDDREPDDPEIVQLLIQHGADILSVGFDIGTVALEYGEGLQRYVYDLQEQEKEYDNPRQLPSPVRTVIPLHCAAGAGNLRKARALLDHSDDSAGMANTQGPWDWTPLHFAAVEGHLDVLSDLMSRGGDIHASTDDGKLVLQFLSFYNGTDVARDFMKECGLYEERMEECELDLGVLRRLFRRRRPG